MEAFISTPPLASYLYIADSPMVQPAMVFPPCPSSTRISPSVVPVPSKIFNPYVEPPSTSPNQILSFELSLIVILFEVEPSVMILPGLVRLSLLIVQPPI